MALQNGATNLPNWRKIAILIQLSRLSDQDAEMAQDNARRPSRLRLSEVDRRILGLLQQDSRRTISEISAATGVSRATVRDRIDIMREGGVIRRFTIEMADDPPLENLQAGAFLHLELKRPVCRIVYSAIRAWPELMGCWSIAGDLDMVIRLETNSTDDLERLRDILCRHQEVKTLKTLTILREWC